MTLIRMERLARAMKDGTSCRGAGLARTGSTPGHDLAERAALRRFWIRVPAIAEREPGGFPAIASGAKQFTALGTRKSRRRRGPGSDRGDVARSNDAGC